MKFPGGKRGGTHGTRVSSGQAPVPQGREASGCHAGNAGKNTFPMELHVSHLYLKLCSCSKATKRRILLYPFNVLILLNEECFAEVLVLV